MNQINERFTDALPVVLPKKLFVAEDSHYWKLKWNRIARGEGPLQKYSHYHFSVLLAARHPLQPNNDIFLSVIAIASSWTAPLPRRRAAGAAVTLTYVI
jgi:hypothetical protein